MTIENNYFSNFSLVEQFICSAISFIPKDDTFELYEQIDDHIIFEAAKKNDVDSIIGYRLIEKYGKDNIPPHWVNSYKSTNEKIASYLEELDRIADIFFKDGIPLVALKNSGIAKAVYPFPGLVPMGDVDTLVRRSDFIHAHEILINNGYEIASPNKYHIADVNIGYREGSSEYTTKLPNSEQLWFELQWRPVEGRFLRSDQEPEGDVLINRSIVVHGSKLRILCPEDNLLQVCLHTAKHSYVRAPGFRLHLDVDRIVNAQKIDWSLFLKNVISHKVKVPVYFSLLIPKIFFNTPIPNDVLKKIKPKPIKLYILSHWIKNIGLFNPDEFKFGKISFLIWNAMLYDSILGMIRAVFPRSSWMQDKYAFNNPLYLPFYYIKRLYDLVIKRVGT